MMALAALMARDKCTAATAAPCTSRFAERRSCSASRSFCGEKVRVGASAQNTVGTRCHWTLALLGRHRELRQPLVVLDRPPGAANAMRRSGVASANFAHLFQRRAMASVFLAPFRPAARGPL